MNKVWRPQTPLEECLALRDITLPWLRAHPSSIEFDLFATPCGTFACLAGRHLMLLHGVTPRQISRHLCLPDVAARFGMDIGTAALVFGPGDSYLLDAELGARELALNGHIKQLQHAAKSTACV